jgi:hypothetical protein
MITFNAFNNLFLPVHQVRPHMIWGHIKLGVKDFMYSQYGASYYITSAIAILEFKSILSQFRSGNRLPAAEILRPNRPR